MFICYLDDSDSDQGNVITLAGYVASLANWRDYERNASAIYARYQIGDVLHAIQFNAGHKPFKGWSVAKKMTFIDDLFAGASLSLGVSMSLEKESFNRHRDHPGIGPNMSALGLCFASIVHQLVRRNPLAGLIQTEGLSFVVETGHKNNADLERYFYRFRDDDVFLGCLRSISFVQKTESRAIHLADLLAFYSRRQATLNLRYQKSKLEVADNRYFKRIVSKLPHLLTATGIEFMQPATIEEADTPWFPVPINYREVRMRNPE